MDDKVMDKDLKENLTEEIIDEAPQASGTPYWNGLERDPSGGYRFKGGPGSQNANGYPAYNMNGAGMNGAGMNSAGVNAAAYPQQKKVSGWVKALIIFLVVCLGLVGCGVACSNIVKGISGPSANNEETYDFRGDYIGVLYLEGTITDGMSGDGYDQGWILERIQQMTEEKNNRGIMLHVNTPGGSAYATSEVYKALLDYKEETGNPVYVYMGSQATSGGYYVAMAADKIYANPECWTGSIGVVVGTLYDLSGLMEKYGIKATNIVSGANKDMGSTAKPLTDEQLAILQSLVDDSFDRFVQAVVDGRGLSESKVRKLADGRIYTAKQALDGGLIDAIGTLDDALNDMMVSNGLENVRAESIQYVMEQNLLGMFGLEGMDRNSQSASGELGILLSLMESSNKVSIEFICPIRK